MLQDETAHPYTSSNAYSSKNLSSKPKQILSNIFSQVWKKKASDSEGEIIERVNHHFMSAPQREPFLLFTAFSLPNPQALKRKKRKVFLFLLSPPLHSPTAAYKTNLLGEQDHTKMFSS